MVEMIRFYPCPNSFFRNALNLGKPLFMKIDQGSFDINLKDAKEGEVVTRFPPEPSGYLHIGHAKAILLNDYFARHYKGKLIVRFDDTNPNKEKGLFEECILEDLELLGIIPDSISHTSDYFPQLRHFLEVLIRQGDAYADDTPQEEMQRLRGCGEPSRHRERTIEESLQALQEMESGEATKTCIRAKISVTNKNKALRDPVIYRVNPVPHYRTNETYKAYPTYDFACPIVDSMEGVTHALRTNEYRDRNQQYFWFLDTLKLRKPHIWDYSRVSFVYTLLSKRKLTVLVEKGIVSGWDDPRVPTIRGILRRGLLVSSLQKYTLMQGASKNVLLLEWDKIWALNRKELDATIPRYTAFEKADAVPLAIAGVEAEEKRVLLYKKKPDLGTKLKVYSPIVLIAQEDARTLEAGEEVTLMDWGNIIIKGIKKEKDVVVGVEAVAHLEGDFKKTKKKLTWLAQNGVCEIRIFDYDFLVTKKKMEEEDKLEDILNPRTVVSYEFLAEKNVSEITPGISLQFERQGNFICDRPGVFIHIPDGKQTSGRWFAVQK